MESLETLIRPIVRGLEAYVPGEQPKIRGLIKLNTNENPYPPAPAVRTALRKAIGGRLRLYPNPTAEPLREALAHWHGCRAENLIVGNGSDELLALATRAFVEPLTGLTHYALQRAANRADLSLRKDAVRGAKDLPDSIGPSRYTVQYLHPSYSLYPVLAAMHGAFPRAVRLGNAFSLPTVAELREKKWDFQAALTFLTTPNAPSGRGYTRAELAALCQAHRGVIVLDEAYVDFAEEDALALALRFPHVLVSRTFSKAYSLCFLRVGYFVGHPRLIGALHKVRDSYNVNGLGQTAAEATLRSLPYYQRNFRRILDSRAFLSTELARAGFEVFPSQTNFILVRPPLHPAGAWLQKLREKKILVRWFDSPGVNDFLRITIGNQAETEVLLDAVQSIARGPKRLRPKARPAGRGRPARRTTAR